jgi:hypothetical protein
MANINKGKTPVKATPLVMTEEMQKAIELVKKHPEMEDLFSVISGSYEELNEALASAFGLDAWFNAYLQSDAFTSLSRDKRAEAFSLYRAIYTFFECIENVCQRHNVGVYKQD